MKLDQSRLVAATLAALLFCAPSCRAPEQSDPAAVDGETGALAHASPLSEQDPAPTANGRPQDPEQDPEQDPQDRQRLSAERARLLVQQYLQSAEEFRRLGGEANLRAARLELLKAREIAPGNEEVARLLRVIAAELQEPVSLPGTFGEEQAALAQINEQRARAEVMALLDSARAALDENAYARAIENVRQAQLRIDVGTTFEWGELRDRTSELLRQAQEARDEAERAEADAVRRRVAAERRAAEEAAEARRQAEIRGLMTKAVRAFERRQFDLARDLAYEAMGIDSTNTMARDLHNAAIKAGRDMRSDQYYRDMTRALRRAQEQDETLRIPQTDILHVDPGVWAVANARVAAGVEEQVADPQNAALRERLRETTISGIRFTEEDGGYDDVRTRLQAITGISIITTPEAREVIEGEDLRLVMDVYAPISIENLLDHMVARSPELAWTVRDGVVQITSRAQAGGNNITDLKDVRDLVFGRTVFLPPTIRDIPTGESTSEEPRTGGEGDEKTFFVELDILVENIKDATGREYWEGDSGALIESAEGGYLIVVANEEMHRAVERVLADLRRFATTVVTIESKFLQVRRNFLQAIGVDFRGLGGSGAKGTVSQLDDVTSGLDDNASRGLDNAGTGDPASHPFSGAFFNDGGDGDIRARTEHFFSDPLGRSLSTTGGATAALVFLNDLELQAIITAVEKREDVEELNGQNLTVLNDQRGHVAVVNQTAYVRDFDVEVAQAAFIADPKIDVIQDGIVLDVRPTVAHDRKKITLMMQPTVAELVRPVPTFSTSLAGTTQPVTVQLPQLLVRSFATTVTVPDGGSVLIGGLREVLTEERRAEVPILGKIPLLSFFFKQEGVVDENSSLMVLVRASITDVKDLMDGF